jgi:hypothetical protein
MWVSQIAKRRWYSSRSWPSRTHVCKSSGDSHARIEAGLRIALHLDSDSIILYV